jgi:hypothetical protein
MQWKLNDNFSILNLEGAEIELKNIDILQKHCVHGPIPAGKNPNHMSFTDSIHKPDHFLVSRVTNDNINVGAVATADATACMPQGNMATIAAAIARISLSPVTVILGPANGNGKEIEICPTVAADAVIDTTDTLVAISKRKKVLDATLSASVTVPRRVGPSKARSPPSTSANFQPMQ